MREFGPPCRFEAEIMPRHGEPMAFHEFGQRIVGETARRGHLSHQNAVRSWWTRTVPRTRAQDDLQQNVDKCIQLSHQRIPTVDAETEGSQRRIDGVDRIGDSRQERVLVIQLRQSPRVGGRRIETVPHRTRVKVARRLEEHGDIVTGCLQSSSANVRSLNMAKTDDDVVDVSVRTLDRTSDGVRTGWMRLVRHTWRRASRKETLQ